MRSQARRLSLAVVTVGAALALAQTGCGRKAFSAEIPADEVLAAIGESTSPLILDVRTPAEFAAGHVPGALNIPIDELPLRVPELADHRDEEIVVYCERGPRALKAAGLLGDAGFASVRHLGGDMSGWRGAGLPIDR